MYTQKQILEFISKSKSLLRVNFHVSKIGLFGSYARLQQSESSDIDLIVEFDDNTQDLYDLKIAIKKFFKDSLNPEVDLCREKYIKPRYRKRILNEAIF